MSAVPVSASAVARWHANRAAVTATVGGLTRVRWAVRAALLLGVAASVAANILHAQPHLVSQLIAAWPPVALLLTVELISRVPVHRVALAAARLAATTAIAGIACWVSYWHMVAVAARYGETGLSAYLLPVSVDGLVVVASVSLVELSGRLRAAQTPSGAAHGTPSTAPAASDAPMDRPPPAQPPADAVADGPRPARRHGPAGQDEPAGREPSAHDRGPDVGDDPHPGDDDAPADGTPRRPRRGATRQAVIDAYLRNPTMQPTAIADVVGTSERSVRRYLDEFRTGSGVGSPNGGGAGHGHNGGRRQPTA
jgi:hypothetical protein